MSAWGAYLALYAVLLFSGAYFGLKAGSKISLAMGIASGALILLGLIVFKASPQFGKYFLTILTALLSVVFLKRLVTTKKFMPAGLLLVASLFAILASINLP
jgi:uncharacterized membrane protein (UPF0136 family)